MLFFGNPIASPNPFHASLFSSEVEGEASAALIKKPSNLERIRSSLRAAAQLMSDLETLQPGGFGEPLPSFSERVSRFSGLAYNFHGFN